MSRHDEKARRDAPEVIEVAVAQRVCQRQNLKAPRHALHLGVQHEANAAYRFQHAPRRILAILQMVVENQDGREENEWQRGPRDQKGKAYGQ